MSAEVHRQPRKKGWYRYRLRVGGRDVLPSAAFSRAQRASIAVHFTMRSVLKEIEINQTIKLLVNLSRPIKFFFHAHHLYFVKPLPRRLDKKIQRPVAGLVIRYGRDIKRHPNCSLQPLPNHLDLHHCRYYHQSTRARMWREKKRIWWKRIALFFCFCRCVC